MARGNRNNNNNENPPPPLPATLEQVLAMQAQLLHSMQQSMMVMQHDMQQHQAPPPRDRLGDFQRTKPPTFSHAKDPMEAEDWLKAIEKKLRLAQYTDRE